MKTNRIIYWVSTSLLTALMLFSVSMYIFSNAEMAIAFNELNYPSYLIYPLATLKLLGLGVIWTRSQNTLKEWAYAGFFFNFVLALGAHVAVGDGEFLPALVAIVLLLTSYFSSRKLINNSKI